jgi:hypothetical protein
MLPPVKNQHEGGNKQRSAWYLLHVCFLLGSLIDTEDGGDMFLQNVGWL